MSSKKTSKTPSRPAQQDNPAKKALEKQKLLLWTQKLIDLTAPKVLTGCCFWSWLLRLWASIILLRTLSCILGLERYRRDLREHGVDWKDLGHMQSTNESTVLHAKRLFKIDTAVATLTSNRTIVYYSTYCPATPTSSLGDHKFPVAPPAKLLIPRGKRSQRNPRQLRKGWKFFVMHRTLQDTSISWKNCSCLQNHQANAIKSFG